MILGQRSPWQKPFLGAQLNRSHPMAQGLVGAWLFNENSGGIANDLSGNGYYGIFSGGVDRYNGNIVFPQNSAISRVLISPQISLYGKSFSLVGKWNLTRLGSSSALIGRLETGSPYASPYYLNIELTPASWQFGFYDSVGAAWCEVRAPKDYATNIDVSLVGTFDYYTKQSCIYSQGVLGESNTFAGAIPIDNPTAVTCIGDWSAANELAGIVYYVYIYDRVLSPYEVLQLHREPYAMFYPTSINTNWNFTQRRGQLYTMEDRLEIGNQYKDLVVS